MSISLDDLINGLQDPKFDYLNYMINQSATANKLDPNLLKSLISVESEYNPNARSKKGAVGLTQLMPTTAKQVGVKDRTNPQDSIRGGAEYLRQLLDQFGSLDKALAAYHGGPTKVSKNKPPSRKTKEYASTVKGRADVMNKPKPPVNLMEYLTQGVNPEYRGQRVINPGGTMSSERSVTRGIDDRFYNIPTLFKGTQLSPEEATRRFLANQLPAVGVADTLAEALLLSQQRSDMLGNRNIQQKLLDYLNL